MKLKWKKMTNYEIMELIGMQQFIDNYEWRTKPDSHDKKRVLRYGGTSYGEYTVLEITAVNHPEKYRFFKGELYKREELKNEK